MSVVPPQPPTGLIRTRFYQPPLPGDFVERTRLIDQLNQGFDRPLTLVSAPAGFGKTVLISSWLNICKRPSAWLALDESVDDLTLFLSYFVTAIQSIDPTALPRTQTLLNGFSLPSIEVLTGSLINELDEIAPDFIIVLEDYHTVHAQGIHDLLAALLRHPLPHMHLVLISRRDPPLTLSVLRARNMVAEVRVQDLHFTAAEIAAFMQNALGFPLPDAAIDRLLARTEGWITSLRLVALALRYTDDVTDDVGNRLAALQGVDQNRYVADYLMSEVLAQVPSELEDFLLRTAILDRMCVPMCNALLGRDEADMRSQANLEWLEQNNLFTISLDTEQHWYRYHHLLQSFLCNQLMRRHGAEEVARLHIRASAWFAEQGLLEDALQHALLGQDIPLAVRLIAANRHALMDTEQWQLHERLLRMFPAEAVTAYPDLTLMAAWMARWGQFDLAPVLALCDQAEYLVAQMADQPKHAVHLHGEINTLRITVAIESASDADSVIELGQQALTIVPQAWYYVRAVTWLWLAVAYQMVGMLDHAYAALAEGQPEDVAQDGSVRARVVGSSCFIAWMAGDLPAIPPLANHLRAVGETHHRRESLGWAHLLLSSVAYQHNDLPAAETHAQALEEMRYVGTPIAYVQSAFVYASIFQARGQYELAHRKLELAITFLTETRSEGLLPVVQAFQMELATRQGDLEAAGQWATSIGPYVPLTLMPYFYAPQLTLPKILLAQGTPASHQQAAAELSRLYDFITATHNTTFSIQVLALQALAHHTQGNEPAALMALQQAVTLAKPGGFVRLFVDLGPALADLLERLVAEEAAIDDAGYIEELLRAFAAEPSLQSPLPAAPTSTPVNMIEPLTRREQEILTMLAQRLTAKEIAQQLVLSDQTVKRHRANIYQKLDVHSRREALVVAADLGLLPIST